MAEMIANLLERQAFGHKMSCAGMAQRMRSLSGTADTQCLQARRHSVMQAIWRQRPQRRLERHEQPARGAARSHLTNIAKDRIANLGGQRVVLLATLLGTYDVKDVMLPVDVVQSQCDHLAAPQAIDRK